VYRNFGACVSAKTREEKTAHTNAAWQCKTERAGDAATFRTTYGTETSNRRKAFGRGIALRRALLGAGDALAESVLAPAGRPGRTTPTSRAVTRPA
jgi:hypothetical protein